MREFVVNPIRIEYDNEILCEVQSFSLKPKDKIGLIGKNGTGKSTILKRIEAQLKSRNIKVMRIDQNVYSDTINSNQSIFDYISSKIDNYWDISENYQLDKNLDVLSGGERMLLEIELASLSPIEVLLLDEPTNHLDEQNLYTLIQLSKSINIPILVISHNVEYLTKATNQIFEIRNKVVHKYGGNYALYLEQRKIEIENEQNRFDAAKKKVESIKSRIEKENERMAKQNSKNDKKKLANDKSTDRMSRGNLTNFSEISQGKRKTESKTDLEKALNTLDSLKIQKTKSAYFGLQNSEHKNKLLFHLEHTNLKLNDKITLNDFTINIHFGDRLHIKGRNGSGKSSLMNYLKSQLENKYKIVYLDQKYSNLDTELSVIENLRKYAKLEYQEERRILGNYLFYTDFQINRKVELLSGGERCRLSLAIMSAIKIDILMLDEPTNNLDIDTKESLLDALLVFEGTILIISHDNDFVEKLKVGESNQIILPYP